ncbi:MAG: YdeI/OmpD-associated family protein [Proteobacteria bacterium]|nr:YdeI/OmpD-associated family protein [Pseudomonadota bacterium]
MVETDRRVGVFFTRLTAWQAELQALSAILLESGLKEEFKWRSPVYTVDGGNVAIIWGFKDHAALGFFKGVLLKDRAGILVAPGENSRSSRVVKLHSVAEIAAQEAVLREYIDEAMAVEKAGLKVDLPKDDLAYPGELIAKLDADQAYREAFEALTPGRRRGYLLYFSEPKKPETRLSRIDKAASRIFAGKGFNER